MHTECSVMHNSTSSSMHNKPSWQEADVVRIIFRILNYYFCLLYSTFISWVRVDDEDVDRSQRRGRGDRIYPGWGYSAFQPDRPRTRELSVPVAQESNDAMMSIALLVLLVLAATASHLAVAAEVMVLDDGTFEHLTQASTGQTTGNWFVKFYAPCECCWLRSLLSFFVGLCWRYALATRSVTCIYLYA